MANFGHATVYHEIRAINKAAFIASEEQDRLSLLSGFPETTRRKVDFASMTLGRIISEPVLQEGCTMVGVSTSIM